MKTIDERSDAYIHENARQEGYDAEDVRTAYIDGAEAEHELLTRWHDPKEERPEPDYIVLTKWKYKDGSGEIISVGGFNGYEWDAHAIVRPELFDIIGWREIHE